MIRLDGSGPVWDQGTLSAPRVSCFCWLCWGAFDRLICGAVVDADSGAISFSPICNVIGEPGGGLSSVNLASGSGLNTQSITASTVFQ